MLNIAAKESLTQKRKGLFGIAFQPLLHCKRFFVGRVFRTIQKGASRRILQKWWLFCGGLAGVFKALGAGIGAGPCAFGGVFDLRVLFS